MGRPEETTAVISHDENIRISFETTLLFPVHASAKTT